MHFVCLRFHLDLSLSVNGQMAIQPYTSHSNYHSAIHMQKHKYFLFWNVQPNSHLAVFSEKGMKISEEPNGNLAVHKSFGHSHSNSNANGIWGIHNTHISYNSCAISPRLSCCMKFLRGNNAYILSLEINERNWRKMFHTKWLNILFHSWRYIRNFN